MGVYDPTEQGDQPHGKQYRAAFSATRASSKYTSTSGIWATVWLEFVPTSYIVDLHVVSTVGDAFAAVAINVSLASFGSAIRRHGICVGGGLVAAKVSLYDGSIIVGSASAAASPWTADGPLRKVATASVTLTLSRPMPKLWSPAQPFLYNATVSMTCDGTVVDELRSYVGIREVLLKVAKAPMSEGCGYQAGFELPGYPKHMESATACDAACVQPACAAWTFGKPPPPPSPHPPPGPPGSKAGPGVDLHGGDLKGMPIQLNGTANNTLATSEKACAALCAKRNYPGAAPDERCVAWVINVPGCTSPGHSSWKAQLCFLKAGGASKPQTMRNKCRISGLEPKGGADDAAASGSAQMCTLHAQIPAPPIINDTSSSCGHFATKLMLNNAPAPFLAGILSQGFWPDGEYTVAADAADVYELTSHQSMGFNFIRKHIKVAPSRWYYHTDRLGILVWQDMPETIHASGSGATFMQELAAMVKGRRNHPSIIQWDLFNEASPSRDTVEKSIAVVRSLDTTRPIDACSGCGSQAQWWNLSSVQDFHTDSFGKEPLNVNLLTAFAEAHRCGCVPPKEHMWFHRLPLSQACYSVTKGVGCDAASQSYLPWAQAELEQVRFFGLSGTGYVQNRDMEGECNGLLTYDAYPKLNSTPIIGGNKLLTDAHRQVWG